MAEERDSLAETPPARLARAERARRAGEPATAWAELAAVLACEPSHPDALKLCVRLAPKLDRVDEALAYLDDAIAQAPQPSPWRYRAAALAARQGWRDRARAYLKAVLAADPGAGSAYNELGMLARDDGDMAAAEDWLRRGEAADPAHASLSYNLGGLCRDQRRWDAAAAAFARAVARDPQRADAHMGLVRAHLARFDPDAASAAQAAGEDALGRTPGLCVSGAQLALEAGQPERAQAYLAAVAWEQLDDQTALRGRYLAGHVADRLGDPGGAVAAFTAANEAVAATPAGQRVDPAAFRRQLDNLAAAYTAEAVADWPRPTGATTAASPIFCVGFPRSGTTLLGTVLGSHPDLVVCDERPLIQSVVTQLVQSGRGYPDGVLDADARELAAWRECYWDAARRELGPDENRRLVDKLPLHIRHIGLIHRLFPDAPIIFVLRHPADAVLSCFMQGFNLSEPMANFWRLDTAAATYDRVMRLWQQYRRLLPLSVATVPYEALTQNFAAVSAQLFAALGLHPPSDSEAYRRQARSAAIRTPSRHQVVQPIYTAAQFRWQRYREALAPVLPQLLSWAESFGYSADGAQVPGFSAQGPGLNGDP